MEEGAESRQVLWGGRGFRRGGWSRLLPWHPDHDVLGERAEPKPLPGHTPREWVL